MDGYSSAVGRWRQRGAATLTAIFFVVVSALATANTASAYTIQGSIKAEYDALVQIGRSPGAAISEEINDRQGGKFQKFVNNNYIYWNARVDPNRGRQVGGAIWDKWGNYDWENGFLGYPKEREINAARNNGKLNRFEGGLIYWSQATGAHPVHGQILQTWAALGYEQSAYGFPKGDEEVVGAGRRQLFENNTYIEWQPEGFEQDWVGDVDTDRFVPPTECNAASCVADATVEVKGPVRVAPTGVQRSANPDDSTGVTDVEPTDGTPYCDELVPDSSADPNEGVICLVRDNFDATGEEQVATPNLETPAPADPQTPPTVVPPTSTQIPTSPTPLPGNSQTSSTAAVPPDQAPSEGDGNSATQSPPSSTAVTSEACVPISATPTTTQPSAPATTTPDVPSCVLPVPPADVSSSSAIQSPASIPGANNFFGGGGNREVGPLRTAITTRDYCQFGHPNFEYGTWGGDRMYQCKTRVFTVGLASRQGRYFGNIRIEEIRTVKLAWNNTAWDDEVNVRVQSLEPVTPADAPILETAQVKFTLGCTYAVIVNCYSGGGTPTLGPLSAGTLQAGGFSTLARKGIVAPGGGSNVGNSNWSWTVTSPSFSTASGKTGNTPAIRCDAGVGLRSTQGCAFRHIAPVLDYTDYTTVGAFRNHVSAAQDSGLPGSPNGAELNRTVDDTMIRQNRAGSCGGVTGPRGDNSCDEYPFASTFEGARYGGPGRTFANCGISDNDLVPGATGFQGYSVCMIPKDQNSRAGAYLSWFYAKNRVMHNDGFTVRVK